MYVNKFKFKYIAPKKQVFFLEDFIPYLIFRSLGSVKWTIKWFAFRKFKWNTGVLKGEREEGDTNKLCYKKSFQIATDFLQAKLYV